MPSIIKFYIVRSCLRNLWTKGKETTVRLLRVFGRMGRGIDRWVRSTEPWGVVASIFARFATFVTFFARFATLVALFLAVVALGIEVEDRQSQRIFRAWEVVFDASDILDDLSPSQEQTFERDTLGSSQPPPVIGSGVRQALQFLNRDFEGLWCGYVIRYASQLMTGNPYRKCVFPDKKRESFNGLRLPRIDISGAQLPDADLTQADLTQADLTQADLTDADLSNANLTEAKLIDANLSQANLTSTNLTRTDLTKVDLTGVTLADATLIGVDLSGATLIGMNLARAILTDATLFNITLTDADLREAILTGADLRDARLTKADLTKADLTKADLTDATLDLVDLRGSTLDSAQLPDVQDEDMCVWHDATGPTQSWVEPADSCRDRLLEFLTELACRDRLTADAVVQKYVDISEPEEQIPPRILDPTEVARTLLEIDPDKCPPLEPHREDLRKILIPEAVATRVMG